MRDTSSTCQRDTFTRSLRVCASLVLAGCSVDASSSSPSTAKGNSQIAGRADLDASPESTPIARDSGVATRGAGMPILPIQRADAGASMPRDAAAEMPAATPPPLLAGTADAGRAAATDAAQATEPTRDAGSALMTAGKPLLPRPIHRYSFSGEGNAVHDEHGGPDAIVQGDAQLDGRGAATFSGAGAGVVKLPDGFLADVTDFTALVWLETRSAECWQRALDFLDAQPTANGPGGTGNPAGTPITSLYLTPYGCPDALPTLGYVYPNAKYHLISQTGITQSELVQLGLSFEARSRTLRLIVNGVVEREQTVPVDVRALQRSQLWLGRSHFEDDPPLQGSITELRIYDHAVDPSALMQLFRHGPDDSP